MKALMWLRILAWGKRGVLALESIAESQRTIAEASAPTRRRVIPKVSEVFTPTIAEMNLEWQRQKDKERYGEELG